MNNYTRKWIIIHKCDKRCLLVAHWTLTIELSALPFMHIYSRFVYILAFLFTFVYNYSFLCIKRKCIIIHCPSRFVQSSLHIARRPLNVARRPPILVLRDQDDEHRTLTDEHWARFEGLCALHRGQSSSIETRWRACRVIPSTMANEKRHHNGHRSSYYCSIVIRLLPLRLRV